MATRRRQPIVAAAAVPVELTDIDDPMWQNRQRFARWLESHRLTLDRFADHGPLSRFHAAAEAWGLSQGLNNRDGRARWVDLRARGVAYPVGRMQERMQSLNRGLLDRGGHPG